MDNPLGMYLFLNIKEGADTIKRMCKKLYTGILEEIKPAWLNENTYLPHMTVGEFNNRVKFEEALGDTELKSFNEKFETIVKKISVEIIDENEDSSRRFLWNICLY
ncbi:MAG: 2'-5' RNA ligase family protein [Clostridium sp.]|nr:2'-5' RNA ligase family protein [Clostridium sp.]